MLYVYNIIGKNWCFLSRSIVRAIVIDFLHRSCSIVRVLLSNQFSFFLFFFQASATPLQRAAAEGHVDIVHQLLKHGADVNHQDSLVSPPPPFFLFFIRNKIICVAHNRLRYGKLPTPALHFLFFYKRTAGGGGGRESE